MSRDGLDPLRHPIVGSTPRRLSNVRSWQGQTPFARYGVDLLRPRTIVELGTHHGHSSAFRPLSATVGSGMRPAGELQRSEAEQADLGTALARGSETNGLQAALTAQHEHMTEPERRNGDLSDSRLLPRRLRRRSRRR